MLEENLWFVIFQPGFITFARALDDLTPSGLLDQTAVLGGLWVISSFVNFAVLLAVVGGFLTRAFLNLNVSTLYQLRCGRHGSWVLKADVALKVGGARRCKLFSVNDVDAVDLFQEVDMVLCVVVDGKSSNLLTWTS